MYKVQNRFIAALQIHNNLAVKTKNYLEPCYIGDPINIARIFSDSEVDEILINAITFDNKPIKIDFALLERISSQCSVPLSYVGGIQNKQQFNSLIKMGFEKIGICSNLHTIELRDIAETFGLQSIMAVIDISIIRGQARLYDWKNKVIIEGVDAEKHVKSIEKLPVGEIIINFSQSYDGQFNNNQFDLMERFAQNIHKPITFKGGLCLNLNHNLNGLSGVGFAFGSEFSFIKQNRKSILVTARGCHDL